MLVRRLCQRLQRKRLKQLLDRCDEPTKRAIIMGSSAGSFIQRIVDVRNYLTHFASPPRGGPPGARDLAEDAARMRRLRAARGYSQEAFAQAARLNRAYMGGGTPIEEANKALNSSFASGDFSTVGGLVFGHLGHAPEVGDEVSLDGYLLRVQEVDGSRVAQVVARRELA